MNEDITSNEGSQIDSLATTYGPQQLITNPTHNLPNSSTCIDLLQYIYRPTKFSC